MGQAGRFSPFDYRIKTHLVASFISRTTSVKQANLKSRNRLNYYCHLFALFWVMPVRAPQSPTQSQGPGHRFARTVSNGPRWPRHCAAKADSIFPVSRSSLNNRTGGMNPGRCRRWCGCHFPLPPVPHLCLNIRYAYKTTIFSRVGDGHLLPIKSHLSAITVEPASGLATKNKFGRCALFAFGDGAGGMVQR